MSLKYQLDDRRLRPFVRGGLGAYIPRSGVTRPGLSVAVGVSHPLDESWELEASVDYRQVFDSGDNSEFLLPWVGARLRW